MSLNTVNVVSIDEERLKYRVIVSFFAPGITQNQGEYKFLLPIPTFFANSSHYNSCLINCNGFMSYAPGANNDPVWTTSGATSKVGALVLKFDIPSTQTSITSNIVAADDRVGNSKIGGYRELILLECKSIGAANGAAFALDGQTCSWSGKSESQPVLCGNPFGQTVTITNSDPISDSPVWLISNGGGAGSADLGSYIYSFDVTMVPNQ